MSSSSNSRRPLAWLAAGLLVAALVAVAWFLWRNRLQLPKPGTPRYEEYAEAFEVGTARLDSGLIPQAIEKLTAAIEIIPQEPAAWANRGLAYLRQAQPDVAKAREDLLHAQSLAPDNADVEELLGHLAEREGNLDEATEHFRKAAAGDPDNLRRLYKLVSLAERSAAPDEERQRFVEQLLERRPTNLHLLALRLQLACRRRDAASIRTTCERLEQLSPEWRGVTRALAAEVCKEARSGKYDIADMGLSVRRLDNMLKAELGYARGMNELSPPAFFAGDSLQQFVRLAPLKTDPSPPDTELTFEPKPLALRPEVSGKGKRWDVVLPAWLNGTDAPVALVANAQEVRRADGDGPVFAFPSGPKAVPPSMAGVLAVDWNNDHLTDFLLAGAGGLRFFAQEAIGKFADVSEGTKLPPAVLKGDYWGAWAADVDLDGDLDIVVAPRQGPPLLLRNNGDGTFLAQPIFPGVQAPRAFVWADLDNDGAPDAALLDAKGGLHVFMNERSGQFRSRLAPPEVGPCVALAVADANDDGVFDLIALTEEGKLLRISNKDKGKAWDVAELARLDKKLPLTPGSAGLQAIDLDNNGAVDLVLRTPEGGVAWLADGKGAFTVLPAVVPPGVADVVSLGENEHLDLLGLDKDGQPTRSVTKGTKGYGWQRVKPRADRTATGDQRVNSFAIGSEVEARVGTLVVKQPVERPAVHIGLGERKKPALLRFVFTNGALQYEFDKPANAVVRVEQRLKGSCPFLFTWDGEKMAFVSDFCWSTPLGLYINAQKGGGGFTETTEWIKVRGAQLKPRDGYYDVRVSATLWETHYLDLLSLIVVDHPPGTEVFCDERFFLTPTKPRLYVTEAPKPVARAWDHEGKDVTDLVRNIDGKYLDHAGLGRYQGVTRDHWVEVDLGDEVPSGGPVYLLAHGWLQPTDSSINVALEQSSHPKPRPLALEVPDGKGGWKVALPALGFPAGKNKTVVIRLDGIDRPGVPRRFRLRTNLEIYWDALQVARGADEAKVSRQTLSPHTAELRYRGVLKMSRASRTAPELPSYDGVVYPGTQPWRDLIGFHTRFGDVKELLGKVDDRYVMMNAGDELVLRFDVPPGPPPGWKRDFVWVSDGWTKDGDLNTKYGKTVLPLPYHGMPDYDAPPGRLEDDPVYRRHAKDWQTYHTRYVTPAGFERGLRAFRRESAKR
jgi:Tfp pilus assembly protein PilF